MARYGTLDSSCDGSATGAVLRAVPAFQILAPGTWNGRGGDWIHPFLLSRILADFGFVLPKAGPRTAFLTVPRPSTLGSRDSGTAASLRILWKRTQNACSAFLGKRTEPNNGTVSRCQRAVAAVARAAGTICTTW